MIPSSGVWERAGYSAGPPEPVSGLALALVLCGVAPKVVTWFAAQSGASPEVNYFWKEVQTHTIIPWKLQRWTAKKARINLRIEQC